MNQRLGPDQRIKKKAEFDFLFKFGRSAKGKFFILWAADKSLPCAAPPSRLPKIAVSVSKRVDSRAVVRNLWKRRIKEAFRRNQEKVLGGTAVLVKVRAALRAETPSYQEIEKELIFLLEKAGFLK